jgi:hypothetical protein
MQHIFFCLHDIVKAGFFHFLLIRDTCEQI